MKLKKLLLLAASIAPTSGALHADEENRSNRFYVEGDLLYWNAHITGLELSAGKSSMEVETEGGTTTTYMNELDLDPHFKWKAGYRIAAGYEFDCRTWALGTVWTHFQDNGTRKVTGDASSVNTTRCRVKFDQIDLVLAYDATPCCCLNFKPFLGIRGAIIQEGLEAFLVTDILYTPSTIATSTRSLDDKQDYHGIGPILGFQGVLNLRRGFDLYGTAAAALLYGNYKVNFQDSTVSTAPISTSFLSKNRRQLHAFDPNIDLALGIRWNLAITDRFQIALKLAFEHLQYFNQSHLGANRGDLTFDGGIFGIDLFFKKASANQP